jgi:hypothetical protein
VNLPRLLAALAAALAQLSLAFGFALCESRLGLAAALALALGWAIAIASQGPSGPPLCLAGSSVLAVLGLLGGAPAWLMWTALAAALFAWDLALFRRRHAGAVTRGERRLERAHLGMLVAGLVPGLILPLALARLELRLPFLALAGAAALCALALYKVARTLS